MKPQHDAQHTAHFGTTAHTVHKDSTGHASPTASDAGLEGTAAHAPRTTDAPDTSPARVWRGERKTPGGKLVAVNVWREPDGSDADAVPAGEGVLRCRIDGDFFIEADGDAAARALLHAVERALERGEDPARAIAAHPGATLVGTDARAIGEAHRRALAAMRAHDDTSGDAFDGTSADTPGGAGDGAAGGVADGTSEGASATVADAPAAARTPAVETDDEADFDARWRRLLDELVIVHDRPRPPREQMATDERWAREVAAGERTATLRLWEWSAPCVVVGRFQSIPDEVHGDEAAREGIEVVRRCTGGGAMFIEPGNTITYSLYAPLWFVEGVDVAASYRLCDRWLVRALRSLGLDVRFAGLNDIASQHGKIGGAAQRRFPAGQGRPGAVLHHVTMAYDIDAAKMTRVLNVGGEKISDKAVKSAVRRVDPMRSQTGMGRGRIIAHLLRSLREARGGA